MNFGGRQITIQMSGQFLHDLASNVLGTWNLRKLHPNYIHAEYTYQCLRTNICIAKAITLSQSDQLTLARDFYNCFIFQNCEAQPSNVYIKHKMYWNTCAKSVVTELWTRITNKRTHEKSHGLEWGVHPRLKVLKNIAASTKDI